MKSIFELARAAGCHDNGKEFRFVELRYLERFAALFRNATLEEAARLCEQLGQATNGTYERNYECAAAIRALKEKQ